MCIVEQVQQDPRIGGSNWLRAASALAKDDAGLRAQVSKFNRLGRTIRNLEQKATRQETVLLRDIGRQCRILHAEAEELDDTLATYDEVVRSIEKSLAEGRVCSDRVLARRFASLKAIESQRCGWRLPQRSRGVPISNTLENDCRAPQEAVDQAEGATGCVDLAARKAAATELEKLRADWAAGRFRGFNKYSGNSMTLNQLEKILKSQQKQLADFLALGDDAVAFSGVAGRTATAIKADIARFEAAGNTVWAGRYRKSLAVWYRSVEKRVQKMRDDMARTREVMAEVRAQYEKKVAALQARIAAAGGPDCPDQSH